MDGKSLDIKQNKLEKLKELFPEVFTEGKVDWDKLKATLGEDINFSNERYVLNWAGKSDAFRALQTPATATLVPDREERESNYHSIQRGQKTGWRIPENGPFLKYLIRGMQGIQ